MLLLIIKFLRNVCSCNIPLVFDYCSARMGLALIGSFFLTIFLGKKTISLLTKLKIGDIIRKEHCEVLGEIHKDKNNVPTMGGLLIIGVLLMSIIMLSNLSNIFVWEFLLIIIGFGGIGAYDDLLKIKYKHPRGLSAKKKLLFQILISCLVVAFFSFFCREKYFFVNKSIKAFFSVTVPFYKHPIFCFSVFSKIVLVLFMIFVLVSSVNAVNLTDGLDGLATGTMAMSMTCFAIIAFISSNLYLSQYLRVIYIEGGGEIAIILCSVLGSCLGFLWYNGYPAQMFMGDTGSLMLGGVLGGTAIFLKRELLLVIIGGVFVIEALSVIIQVSSYKLRRKRIFLCSPLHHHFEYQGIPETKVVLRFWLLALVLSAIGLTSLKFQ